MQTDNTMNNEKKKKKKKTETYAEQREREREAVWQRLTDEEQSEREKGNGEARSVRMLVSFTVTKQRLPSPFREERQLNEVFEAGAEERRGGGGGGQ